MKTLTYIYVSLTYNSVAYKENTVVENYLYLCYYRNNKIVIYRGGVFIMMINKEKIFRILSYVCMVWTLVVIICIFLNKWEINAGLVVGPACLGVIFSQLSVQETINKKEQEQSKK